MSKKLCYIESDISSPEVYFTTAPLTGEHMQWGDDWNDAPYENNAGSPYTWYEKKPGYHYPCMDKAKLCTCENPEYDVYTMKVDLGDLSTPQWFGNSGNSPYSVRSINELEVPWLLGRGIAIWAGCSPEEFVELLKQAGGEVLQGLKLEPRR